MPESLLDQSRILLFGQKIEDLAIAEPDPDEEVRVATVRKRDAANFTGLGVTVDGIAVVLGDRVLVKNQSNKQENGIYTVDDNAPNIWPRADTPDRSVVKVLEGSDKNTSRRWIMKRQPKTGAAPNQRYLVTPRGGGLGQNKQLADQFLDAGFAKIYGFSYEGKYYDLARPTLFLVHGDGEQITEDDAGAGVSREARAPRRPGDIGLSVADFQFSDEMRVWAYDKADYTIRMDVEAGMFEQVLMEAELDEEAIEAFYSGQRARVSGQRARVSGQRARVSGQRVRSRDRGD